jgi:HEAT repeat protein
VVAEALIKASPSDATVIRKVLGFTGKRSEVHVTIVVLNALSWTHNPEALDFIGKSLDNENRDVREQTIQAVGHLDRDVRVGFVAKHAAQFGRLAADPEIRSESRRQAADALSNREMVR